MGFKLLCFFVLFVLFENCSALVTKEEQMLSLHFEEIDVKNVLTMIAQLSGMNIISSETVAGKVTLHLQDVPWEEALEVILKTKGLAKYKMDNILWIAPLDEIIAKEKWEWQLNRQHEESGVLETQYFNINHAKASAIASLLKSNHHSFLSSRGTLSVDERTNTLLIQDVKEKLMQIETLIEKCDTPVQQVLIESRIVFVMEDLEKALGIVLRSEGEPLVKADHPRLNISLPAVMPNGISNVARLGLTLAKLPHDTLLDLELMALESEGLGKIISSPRLLTSNQQQAYIESGEEIPYQETTSSGATSIAFKKAVLRLEVTPQITLDEHIILDLKVNQDSRGVVTNGVPAINTREMRTQVLINNGETLVLGGIYQHHKTQNKLRVPILGRLPLVGWLFRNKTHHYQKNTLMIFVTPYLIPG